MPGLTLVKPSAIILSPWFNPFNISKHLDIAIDPVTIKSIFTNIYILYGLIQCHQTDLYILQI